MKLLQVNDALFLFDLAVQVARRESSSTSTAKNSIYQKVPLKQHQKKKESMEATMAQMNEQNNSVTAPPYRRSATTAVPPAKSKSHSPPFSSSEPPAHKLAKVNIKNGSNGNNPNGGASHNGNASAAKKEESKSKSSPTSKKQKSSKQVSRKISSAISKAITHTTSSSSSTNNAVSSSSNPEPINYYLPQYLSNIVFPYHGEFYQSQCYDPHLLVQLMSEGFLPISTSRLLLPKLHNYRCAIPPPLKSNIHISKSTRKKSSRFALTLNQNFDAVVAGCHKQHGISWLYPRIVAAFKYIFEKEGHTLDAMIFDEVYGRYATGVFTPVRIYSVEVWNVEKNEIVAGELGYSVGKIYTSLTGFSAEDSSGSVQLAALGVLLEKCGFEMWDLGMGMDYKTKLGAVDVPKDDFLRVVRGSRVGYSHIELKLEEKEWTKKSTDSSNNTGGEKKKEGGKQKPILCSAGKVNCRHIIDLWRQEQQQQQNPKNDGSKNGADKSTTATKKEEKPTASKKHYASLSKKSNTKEIRGDNSGVTTPISKKKKKLKKSLPLQRHKDQEASKSDVSL